MAFVSIKEIQGAAGRALRQIPDAYIGVIVTGTGKNAPRIMISREIMASAGISEGDKVSLAVCFETQRVRVYADTAGSCTVSSYKGRPRFLFVSCSLRAVVKAGSVLKTKAKAGAGFVDINIPKSIQI